MSFEEKLRSVDVLGGQSAPLASHGSGVQALYRCPLCQRIWLQDGAFVILDMRPEQVLHLARTLSADLKQLPSSACRLCLWRHGRGTVSVDEYDQGEGFGLCWEMRQPTVIHATCAILSQKGASNPESNPDVLIHKEKLRAVVRAVQGAQPPREILALPQEFGQFQAADLRPGFGQPGTHQWIWQGWCFSLPCPPLSGEAIVTLMLAHPRTERVSPEGAFRIWQLLMQVAGTIFAAQ